MKTVSIIALALMASPLAVSAGPVVQPDTTSAPVLGSCTRFALHGFAGVAASGDETVIHGDVGGDNAITGFGSAPLPHVHEGAGYDYYSVTSESNSCAADKQIAYDAAKAATCTVSDTPTELSGITLTPGVYCNDAGFFELSTGSLTLDGGGNSDSVFIFQTATTVTTSVNTNIVLQNGAQAKNLFWAAGSAINLAGYSTFRGNLLAYSTVTFGTGTVLSGRAFGSTASITLAGANWVSLPELLPGSTGVVAKSQSDDQGSGSIFSLGHQTLSLMLVMFGALMF